MLFLERQVYKSLLRHLQQPEISLILGPRQAGKTTLMRRLEEKVKEEGGNTAFFNLDVLEDRYFFETQHTLLDRIKKTTTASRAVVFIDEVQRLTNAGLFLKGLYDLKTGYKFVVSGSGSLELKANIVESLVGRKQLFLCYPLSFSEFCAYKLDVPLDAVQANIAHHPYLQNRLTMEYVAFGGYPQVVLKQTINDKIDALKEILQSYLEQDIQLLLGLERDDVFRNLVKILAGQVGSLINRAELANTLGTTEKTIKKYLYLLDKTFIIELIRPFSHNVRKEVSKSPKAYFLDLGLLHFSQGILPKEEKIMDGHVFENACFLRLKELALLSPVYFWRTTTGTEIDFVINDSRTGKPIPIEAKIGTGKKIPLGKNLLAFINRYRPSKSYLYTLKTTNKLILSGTACYFIPFWKLPKV